MYSSKRSWSAPARLIRFGAVLGSVLLLGSDALPRSPSRVTALALQQVNNPTVAEFAPSPDHAATNPVLLDRYLAEIVDAQNVVRKTTDLGKPTPVNNLITISATTTPTLASTYAGLPTCPLISNVVQPCYALRVLAEGVGGRSGPSNAVPFGVGQPARAPTAPGTLVVR